MSLPLPTDPCPCRPKSDVTAYAACCQPYHTGSRLAPAAEPLMRSRYSAFAFSIAPYLLETWHPLTRPPRITITPGEIFISLKILSSQTVGINATVAFVARSRAGGRSQVLHETSRFVSVDNRWFYLDGIMSS